ncbi:glycosyltransferase [bacterium]|nr:glycosyltransferase [bacterium]
MAIDLTGRRVLVAGSTDAFGSFVPDSVLIELVAALERVGARVELMQVPFQPRTEDEVIRNMTAWSMFDFGQDQGSWYDLVIATSFPAYMLHHRRLVSWVLTDYRLVLDLYGTAGPLFTWSLDNEQRRALVLRLLRNALQSAGLLFFSTAEQAERAASFLDLTAPVLDPACVLDCVQGMRTVAALKKGLTDPADDKRALMLICDGRGLDHITVLLKKVETVAGLRLIVACPDMVRQDILNRVSQSDQTDRVNLIGEYDRTVWQQSIKRASVLIDLRPDDGLNPVVFEACRAGKPLLVHTRALWSKRVLGRSGMDQPVFDDAFERLFSLLDCLYDRDQARHETDGARSLSAVQSWDQVLSQLIGPLL